MNQVSVCIPTYNGAAYIAEAVASVLNQTFTGFELIISDDNSTDNTLSVVESFPDDRLRVVRNHQRRGLVGNWNHCLELARGEFITLFHQDDVMRPENLAEKLALLRSHPGAGLVYSDIERIDAKSRVIGGHYVAQPDETTVMPGCRLFALAAAVGNPVACPTVMARAGCYREVGLFDERLEFAVDLEMWLRMAARYDVGFIARPLVAHRVHAAQEGGRYRDTGRDFEDVLRALDMVFSRELPDRCAETAFKAYQTLAAQARTMARWQARRGRIPAAARYLVVACRAAQRLKTTPPVPVAPLHTS